MTLRTTFTGALDSKLAQARQAGSDSILVDSLTTITTAITAAANQGKTKFTVNIPVTYQPADLRGTTATHGRGGRCGYCGHSHSIGSCPSSAPIRTSQGNLWFAYQTGVQEALASQDIMNNEVTVVLNTSDQVSTSLDLNFDF